MPKIKFWSGWDKSVVCQLGVSFKTLIALGDEELNETNNQIVLNSIYFKQNLKT